jgi:hypothetical protein
MNAFRLKLYPLFRGLRLNTLATGNDYTNAAQRLYLEIDMPELTHALLYAEDITFLSLAEAHVTNLNWGLYLYSGFNRGNELPPALVGATVSANGPLRHNALPAANAFNIESRFAIGYGYATGQAGLYTGLASGALLVRFPGA